MGAIVDSFVRALTNESRRAAAQQEPCSAFAARVRQMGAPFPGPFTFRWHPWTREVHDCRARVIVVEKAAQTGFTEVGINRALHDVVSRSRDALYVLPDDDMASKFSSGRLDAAIETSSFLRDHFTDVSNVGHKRARSVNLYVIGSRSRSNVKSTPCANLTLDELNEMHEKHVELLFQRVSGYPEDRVSIFMLSTPTIPEFGISEFIKSSSAAVWRFNCLYCGKRIGLEWPRNFRVDHNDPAVLCHLCHRVLEGEEKRIAVALGAWEHDDPERRNWCAGYRGLSQLYSNTVSARTIQEAFEKAQMKTSAEQEFYNGRMGVPHVARGARLDVEDVRACIGTRQIVGIASSTTMGVDVGKWYHWVASEWKMLDEAARQDDPMNWRRRIVALGKCRDTKDLGRVIKRMGAYRVVIDAQPETREVRRLQAENRAVWIGWLREQIEPLKAHASDRRVDVDRTEWMDTLFDRIRSGRERFELPSNAGEEFMCQLIVPTRVLVVGGKGDEVARYQSASADHFAFAALFDEVAHHLAFVGGRPPEIVTKKKGDDDNEAGEIAPISDPRRHAADLLEKITGSRRKRR